MSLRFMSCEIRIKNMKSNICMTIVSAVLAGWLATSMAWGTTKANVPETWDTGLQSWVTERLEGQLPTVQNIGGSVSIVFNALTTANPETARFGAGQNGSQGMFYGNLAAVGARGARFTISSIIGNPTLQLVIKNQVSQRSWRCTVSVPPAGETITLENMFDIQAGWTGDDSPYLRDADKFKQDLNSVTLLAIEISGDTATRQGCTIDNFELIGPYMAGLVSYSGAQKGDAINIVADDGIKGVPTSVQGTSGAYLIDHAPAPGSYSLKAYIDINGNGVMDYWEPQGVYAGNSFNLTQIIDQADITLIDPTKDGVPYWWLAKKLGINNQAQADAKSGAEWVQQYAQTEFTINSIKHENGKVALQWDYIPSVQLQIYGSSDLAGGFDTIGSAFESQDSTGEGKTVVEVEDNGAAFFKVKIVQ